MPRGLWVAARLQPNGETQLRRSWPVTKCWTPDLYDSLRRLFGKTNRVRIISTEDPSSALNRAHLSVLQSLNQNLNVEARNTGLREAGVNPQTKRGKCGFRTQQTEGD